MVNPRLHPSVKRFDGASEQVHKSWASPFWAIRKSTTVRTFFEHNGYDADSPGRASDSIKLGGSKGGRSVAPVIG